MQIHSDNNLIAKLTQEQNTVQPSGKRTAKPDNTIAAALDNGFETILREALNPANEQQLIEQTRLDLKQGRVESEAAFEQAADHLLTYGL